jgi:hypothetical protein
MSAKASASNRRSLSTWRFFILEIDIGKLLPVVIAHHDG